MDGAKTLNISPCTYPRCDDGEGNPALTTQGICEYCRERFHQVLGWLFEDYQTLKQSLPKPVRTAGNGGGTAPTGFGHPAEWASTTAQEIAAWATEVYNEFSEDNPISPQYLSNRTDEQLRISITFGYLKRHFDALCEWDRAGIIATEANELHHTVRRGLGKTRLIERLAAPCPRCHAMTLTRSPGYDTVSCGGCGHRMLGREYELGAKWTLTETRDDAAIARDSVIAMLEHAEHQTLYARIATGISQLATDQSAKQPC